MILQLTETLNELAEDAHKHVSDAETYMPRNGEKSPPEALLDVVMLKLSSALVAHHRNNHADQKVMDSIEGAKFHQFESQFLIDVVDTHEDCIANALIHLLAYCGKAKIDIRSHVYFRLLFLESKAIRLRNTVTPQSTNKATDQHNKKDNSENLKDGLSTDYHNYGQRKLH